MVNISSIYILGLILISRLTTGYYYGIFASIFCVIFVNYLFTFPYFRLNFLLTGYPITFLAMLSVTIIISTLTSHMSEQAKIIAKRDQQLMEAEKEKIRANLLRAVSHDLRTPLTSIIGSINSIQENDTLLTSSEKHELLNHIQDDSNWLLNMVENLLLVTRIQGNQNKIKKSLEVVEEVIQESVTRTKKRIPDLNINVTVPSDFLMAPMDPMLIEQVIINLLENAYKHSSSKEPIELTVESNTQWVTFSVIDHGIGIAKERIETIFDGFPCQEHQTADGHKGMGIGLSICKSIVLAHDGEISVINHDPGAEFIFKIPTKEDEYD